jgi:hypothetical protein
MQAGRSAHPAGTRLVAGAVLHAADLSSGWLRLTCLCLDGDGCANRSTSFYIRYREETRMICEAVVFHVELPVPSDFLFEPLVVQFELLFQKPLKARALPSAVDGAPAPRSHFFQPLGVLGARCGTWAGGGCWDVSRTQPPAARRRRGPTGQHVWRGGRQAAALAH